MVTVNWESSGFEVGEKELNVSEVLLNLPYLFTKSLTDYRFSYCWVSKRRRTVPGQPRSPRKPILKPPEATSPDTPLSFCSSECETKSRHLSTTKKTSVKKTRDEFLQEIKDKTQNQNTLAQKIGNVKLHLRDHQDENSKSKAKKQKLMVGMKEKTQLEGCDGLKLQLHNDCVLSGASTSRVHQHQPQLIPPHLQLQSGGVMIHPTAQMQLQYHQQQQHQQVGPLGFDLNVPAAEEVVQFQPLDHHNQIFMIDFMSRAYREQTRAARHHRMQQNKAKRTQRGS